MAKQYSVTVSVNGGASSQQNVAIKDTESLFDVAFYFRVWKKFTMDAGDRFEISAISGPTTVSDPMTWDAIPSGLAAILIGRQISLAFINGG